MVITLFLSGAFCMTLVLNFECSLNKQAGGNVKRQPKIAAQRGTEKWKNKIAGKQVG